MPTQQPDPNAPFYIILNAGSGHEETHAQRATIEEVMHASGRRHELIVVEQPSELASIARRTVAKASADGGIVVAAGGDGTINTIACEAIAGRCFFGVLPQGTFNYFGRAHGLPEDLGDATRALLGARVHPVQVGMVNERIFLVNASIGLYPRLLEERERDKAQFGRSRFVAMVSALKTVLGAFKHLRLVLEIDGQRQRVHTPTLFIGNNHLQFEQIGIAPLSEAIEDGHLAAVAPHSIGTLGLLGLLARGAIGRLGEADEIVAFGFKDMRVHRRGLASRRRIKVATDGEVCHLQMPLHFQVLADSLLLLKGGEDVDRGEDVDHGEGGDQGERGDEGKSRLPEARIDYNVASH